MDDNLKKLLRSPNVEPVKTVDNAIVNPGDLIMLGVSKEAVEKGHVQYYLREFEKFEKRNFRNRVILTFLGYDFDSREIYEVPEVRKWVSRILTKIPHLFYFLTPENYGIRVTFLCIAPVVSAVDGRVNIDKRGSKMLIEKLSKSAVIFAKKLNEPVEVQFAVAETIMAETGYDQL